MLLFLGKVDEVPQSVGSVLWAVRFIDRSKRVFIKNEFRAREHWIWGQTAQDRSVAVPQTRCLDLDNLLNLSVLTYKSGKIIEPLHRSRYED